MIEISIRKQSILGAGEGIEGLLAAVLEEEVDELANDIINDRAGFGIVFYSQNGEGSWEVCSIKHPMIIRDFLIALHGPRQSAGFEKIHSFIEQETHLEILDDWFQMCPYVLGQEKGFSLTFAGGYCLPTGVEEGYDIREVLEILYYKRYRNLPSHLILLDGSCCPPRSNVMCVCEISDSDELRYSVLRMKVLQNSMTARPYLTRLFAGKTPGALTRAQRSWWRDGIGRLL